MLNTFTCIYCNRPKPIKEKTVEHIWPTALGGDKSPEFFKSKFVCKKCNDLCGVFVDGQFVRSFFTHTGLINNYIEFLNTSKPQSGPLLYKGEYTLPLPWNDDVCESWSGLRGEPIYFFHNKDRDDYFDFAKGDPIKRNENPGRIYLAFTKPNLYWVLTALLSVKENFPKAELRLLTQVDNANINKMCASENNQSGLDRTYIKNISLTESKTQMGIALDHGTRFQAKLALGFGHALYGSQFGQLPYAAKLRSHLWTKKFSDRSVQKLFNTSRFQSHKINNEETLKFAGAYTLIFWHFPDFTYLNTYDPGGNCFHTAISDNGVLIESYLFQKYRGGIVVILLPGQNKFFGPYSIDQYLSYRLGNSQIKELTELESSRKSIDQIEDEIKHFELSHSE